LFFMNMNSSIYPRINRPDNAGIRRRLFDSSTEAKAIIEYIGSV